MTKIKILPENIDISKISLDTLITEFPDTQIHLSQMINLRTDKNWSKSLGELNDWERQRIISNGFKRNKDGSLFAEISQMSDMSFSDLYC